MKFSCLKENLLEALSLVGGVAGKNLNLPILSNVLLRAGQGNVEVCATNLEVAIVAQVRAKVETEGSFTVPARTITDFVNLVKGDRLDVSLVESELSIVAGKTNTAIKGSSAEDFPIIPEPTEGDGFLIDAQELKNGLQAVLPAIAKTDIRPELAGVYCSFNNKTITLAATDSYRLAEKKLLAAQGDAVRTSIIPGRCAQELMRILANPSAGEEKQARLVVSDNQLVVTFRSGRIVSRLVAGSYPDYNQIIPTSFKTTLTVSVPALLKEIKAAGLFTTTGVNAVQLEADPTDGKIKIISTSTQAGQYNSELEADIAGDPNKTFLNHHYLIDGLNAISTPEAKIQLINHETPCLLTSTKEDGLRYVVMPIRQ